MGGWLPPAMAADDEPEGLSGEAELGIVATSGNTDTRSFNAKGSVVYREDAWRHEARLQGLHASDGGTTTAERYLAVAKSDYHFTQHEYLFGTVRYEDDEFSGYDYQLSEVAGYGRRIVERADLKLDLELGVGGRHSREADGVREDEAIVHGGGKLRWQVSPSARFTEEILLQTGRENLYGESVSALKLKINGNLSTKISLTVRHNSSVPADKNQTDTLTAVTLVYDF